MMRPTVRVRFSTRRMRNVRAGVYTRKKNAGMSSTPPHTAASPWKGAPAVPAEGASPSAIVPRAHVRETTAR